MADGRTIGEGGFARHVPGMLAGLMALVILATGISARNSGYAAFLVDLLVIAAWLGPWKKTPPVSLRPAYWLAAFAALSVFSIAWALDRSVSATRAAEMAPLLVIGGLGVCTAPALAMRLGQRFLWLLPAAYALALALTLFELHNGFALHRLVHGGDRIVGTKNLIRLQLLNRDILALTLFFAPVAGVILALDWRPRLRWLAVGGLAVFEILILFVTASQTAQLAFALITGFALAFPYRWRAARYALIALTVVLVFATPLLTQFAYARIAPLIAASQNQEVMHAYMPVRMEIWDFVSRYALQRPLTGFGIDATRAVPAFDNKERFTTSLTTPHPHNFAVQLWMEFGALGAALGAAFLAAILLAIFRRPVAQQRIFLPTFIAGLASASMTFSTWQGWWLGTLVFTATLAVLRRPCRLYFGKRILMLRLLIHWALSALAVAVVARVVPGFEIASPGVAFIAALVIGLINATLGLVLKILTLPLSILTLGLFWFVINALMIELAASFVSGFNVASFGAAFIGGMALTIINILLKWFVEPKKA